MDGPTAVLVSASALSTASEMVFMFVCKLIVVHFQHLDERA